MDDLPPIDYRAARRVGRAAIPLGPPLSPREASEVAAGLRDAAAASVEHAARVTALPSPPDAGPMLVVDRTTWVDANVDMVRALLAEASGEAGHSGLRGRLEGLANGAQVGGALAFLSGRVLGQYVPFGPPRLLLVAPNVAKLERSLGVEPDDFRLWVCLHEQTHRLQFAAAPWLRTYLAGQLGELLAAEDVDEPGRRGPRLPSSVIDLVVTPAQRVVFDKVTAAMSLLEGYADVMMDRVGPEVVPTVAAIRERFQGYRERGGWSRVVNKLLGMDLKLAQYRDGAAFCRAVIDRVGVVGLNAVYESSGLLPTLEEIHRPEAWLARSFPEHAASTDAGRPGRPDAS